MLMTLILSIINNTAFIMNTKDYDIPLQFNLDHLKKGKLRGKGEKILKIPSIKYYFFQIGEYFGCF